MRPSPIDQRTVHRKPPISRDILLLKKGNTMIGSDAALHSAVDAETLETLDEGTVVGLLEFRYRYLVDAGFGIVSALMLATRMDQSLELIVSVFNEPIGAAA